MARRALDELGITLVDLQLVLPDFRYIAVDAAGIVENEICPVFTARTSDDVLPDPDEVAEHRWVAPEDVTAAVTRAAWAFSPWLALQLPAMAAARA